MTQINNLQAAADGGCSWGVSTGGAVEGATAYSEAAFAGRVESDGYEAMFHARDGKTRRLSLAPLHGDSAGLASDLVERFDDLLDEGCILGDEAAHAENEGAIHRGLHVRE